jgi:hypothetical protein
MPSKKHPATKNTIRGDLVAARNELKQFRHDVSILKKKGLIDKKYDARSVKPSRYLKDQIKKFAQVLSGEATPVKVSKEKAAIYKKRGMAVKNGRVIVPHYENEKVYSTHGDFRVRAEGKGGSITKIDLGFQADKISEWIEKLRRNRIKLKSDEGLRFQFFGNNVYAGFTSYGGKTAQENAADWLERYERIEELTRETNDAQSEFIHNITVFKVRRNPATDTYGVPMAHPRHQHLSEEESRRYAERARQRAEKRRQKLGRMTDEQFEQYANERAERERMRRQSMSPEEREAYRQRAKDRAAKSRARRKGQ